MVSNNGEVFVTLNTKIRNDTYVQINLLKYIKFEVIKAYTGNKQ